MVRSGVCVQRDICSRLMFTGRWVPGWMLPLRPPRNRWNWSSGCFFQGGLCGRTATDPQMHHVTSCICLALYYLLSACIHCVLLLPFERRGIVSIFMAEDNEIQGSLYTPSEGQSWPLSGLLPLNPGYSVSPPTMRTGNVSEIEVDAQSLQWISLQWKILLYDFVYLKHIYLPQHFSISFFKTVGQNAGRKVRWMLIKIMDKVVMKG